MGVLKKLKAIKPNPLELTREVDVLNPVEELGTQKVTFKVVLLTLDEAQAVEQKYPKRNDLADEEGRKQREEFRRDFLKFIVRGWSGVNKTTIKLMSVWATRNADAVDEALPDGDIQFDEENCETLAEIVDHDVLGGLMVACLNSEAFVKAHAAIKKKSLSSSSSA